MRAHDPTTGTYPDPGLEPLLGLLLHAARAQWKGAPDGDRYTRTAGFFSDRRVDDSEGRSWVRWGNDGNEWHLFCGDGLAGFDNPSRWVPLGHFVDGEEVVLDLHDALVASPGIGGWNDLPASLGGLGPEVDTMPDVGLTTAELWAELGRRLGVK